MQVVQAQDSEVPQAGTAYLAATTDHLVITSSGLLSYQKEPLDLIHRPSVDVFLQSVARNWKSGAVGVILTGMGSDGAQGLLAMRARGFLTLAQDEATSAIYGMPKAAAEIGAVTRTLSLNEIAPELVRCILKEKSRSLGG